MSFLGRVKRRIQHQLGLLPDSFETIIAPLVSDQATNIMALHTASTSGKALFIDMGSNLGQGFNFFSKYYDPNIFDYWLIEANPYCIDQLSSNVSKRYKDLSWVGTWKIINVAISNFEGNLKLYGLVEDHRGKTSDGASVIKEHNSAFYDSDESKAIEVKAVKASKLVEDAAQKYATIVVKMDIEAAEYDALEDMIASGSIDKVSHIYVEWHSEYFVADKRSKVLAREIMIKSYLSDKQTDWH